MHNIDLSELPDVENSQHKLKMFMKAIQKEKEKENQLLWQLTNYIFAEGRKAEKNGK